MKVEQKRKERKKVEIRLKSKKVERKNEAQAIKKIKKH